MKGSILEANLKIQDKSGNGHYVYHFVDSNLGVERSLKTRRQ